MRDIGPLEGLLVVSVAIIPSVLVAQYAKRKGYDFWEFFFLGLFFTFVISLTVALVVKDKSAQDRTASYTDLDRLQKLADLHKSGALTDEEFAVQKNAVLQPQQPAGPQR